MRPTSTWLSANCGTPEAGSLSDAPPHLAAIEAAKRRHPSRAKLHRAGRSDVRANYLVERDFLYRSRHSDLIIRGSWVHHAVAAGANAPLNSSTDHGGQTRWSWSSSSGDSWMSVHSLSSSAVANSMSSMSKFTLLRHYLKSAEVEQLLRWWP